MYIFKQNDISLLNQTSIAKQIGIAKETVNRIFNKKQKCSKVIAYCITKTINQNAEIEEYFERVK